MCASRTQTYPRALVIRVCEVHKKKERLFLRSFFPLRNKKVMSGAEQVADVAAMIPLLFTTREKSGIKTYSCLEGENHNLAITQVPELCFDQGQRFVYSNDGKLLAISEANSVKIVNVSDRRIISEIQRTGVTALSFSPQAKYLITFDRFDAEKNSENLNVWICENGAKMYAFEQRNFSAETWPSLQFIRNETVLIRQATNQLFFYEIADFESQRYSQRLAEEGLSRVSTNAGASHSNGNDYVVTFIPEKRGNPGKLKIYNFPKMETPVITKTFFKANDVTFLWNSEGTAILIWTHTDVDKSGKSYYGESGLYFIDINGKIDINIDLKRDGPIHDVNWSPDSRKFVVVHGFMPAQTTIFNKHGNPDSDLGTKPRNTARFSNNSRLIAVAGFGNLQGDVDVWDHRKLAKLGESKSACSANYEWSPDSQFILTGVLTPRMRVDNRWRIHHYSGIEVANVAVDELYEIHWQPQYFKNFPIREIPDSLYEKAAKPVEKKVYRPPGAVAASSSSIRKEEEAQRYSNANQDSKKSAPAKSAKPKSTIPGDFEDFPKIQSNANANAKPKAAKAKAANAKGANAKAGNAKGGNSNSNSNANANANAANAAANAIACKAVGELNGEERSLEQKRITKKLKQIKQLKEKIVAGLIADIGQNNLLATEQPLRDRLAQIASVNAQSVSQSAPESQPASTPASSESQ
jgi:translation initiation factor 2A